MKNQFLFLWPTFGICLSAKTLILLIRSLTHKYNNWNTNRQEKQATMGFETAKRPLNFLSKPLKGPVFIVKAVLEGTIHHFARVRFCATVT